MAFNQLAEHTSLVSRMRIIARRGRELIVSKHYSAPADPEINIRSWKMNEHGYYELPSPYPVPVRGLFTQWLPAYEGQPEGKEGGHWRIVARGYDKFFDIGETEWTSWGSLEAHTEGPYDLTIMSNGCRILIAALTPQKLLITSKHSLGPSKRLPVSHAQMGECWLDRHLESVGKTQADFAARLWKDNWTVVCELCDDAFEEHVLPIAPEKTGLHLHGINTSQPNFQTQPPDFLYAFAEEWGLIPTPYLSLNSLADVSNFTRDCAKTGSLNGEAVEGFVVRTHVKCGQSQNSDAHNSAPPYPSGHSLFFKVKFDEPYTMYRDFRDITRAMLRGDKDGGLLRAPHNTMTRPETRVYEMWVKSEIQRDRRQFDGFMQGHGIIATRNRFFTWLTTVSAEKALSAKVQQKFNTSAAMTAGKSTTVMSTARPRPKWVIFPVAIPGCGKTSIAIALSHLFGFAHAQSDDVTTNGIVSTAPIFLDNVARLLDKNDIVIADRNNHLSRHRSSLRLAIATIRPHVKLLALNWATNVLPRNTVQRICADRVAARGDNHQSLIPGDYRAHEDVLWRFLKDIDSLKEDEYDACIEMDVEANLEQSLARAVDGIVSTLGLPKPCPEQIGEALARARGYQTPIKAAAPPRRQHPRYYGLLPEADFATIARRRILTADAPTELRELWRSAIAHSREKTSLVVARPHVTLVHETSLVMPEGRALWDRCAALAPGVTFRLRFSMLAYNDRVLAAVLDDIQPGDGDESARTFVDQLSESARKPLSVTVARRHASIMPVEARQLVEKWKEDPSGVKTIALSEAVDVLARVRGFAK